MTEAKEAIMRIKDFGLYHAIEDLPKSTLTVEAFNKAIELLRLEESGSLFTTPYKLNDVVYIIGDNDEIKETSIDGFQIRKLNGGFELCILTPIYDDIRQTGYNVMAEDGVFLTREEAEVQLKLKEMK